MDTLGIVESRTIAAGVQLADAMLKSAPIALVRAATICSGRYLIVVSGSRGEVATAVHLAEQSGRNLSGAFVLANISPQVVESLGHRGAAYAGGALAVIESRAVSPAVAAADATVKGCAINLLRLVAGQGINGKAYFVFSGELAAVEEGAHRAQGVLGDQLLEAVVIPRPEPALIGSLVQGGR